MVVAQILFIMLAVLCTMGLISIYITHRRNNQPVVQNNGLENQATTNHQSGRALSTQAPEQLVTRKVPPLLSSAVIDIPVSKVAGIVERASANTNTNELVQIALEQLTPKQRQATLIAAAPGDGKTQTMIHMMLADIERGYQVAWLSTHLTLFHPEDQPTDLRPVAHLFQQIAEGDKIVAALKHISSLIDVRLPLYRRGADVGQDIVLYIDEWPGLVEDYGDEITSLLRRIVREARKCKLWPVIVAQDAQVETLGFRSGVRSAFTTRLLSRFVDQGTWQGLVGPGVERPKLPKYSWIVAGSVLGKLSTEGQIDYKDDDDQSRIGIGIVNRFSAHEINYLATISTQRYTPLPLERPGKSTELGPIEVATSETKLQPVSDIVSSIHAVVSPVNTVSEPLVTTEEVVEIMMKLNAKMSASDIAKTLPGYKPRKYLAWKAKVDFVVEALQKVDSRMLEQSQVTENNLENETA